MICPKCGSADVSMIVHEIANVTTSKAQKRINSPSGIIQSDSTKWECDDCQYKWGTIY